MKQTFSFNLETDSRQSFSNVSWVPHCSWQQDKGCQGWAGSLNFPRPWEVTCLGWRPVRRSDVLRVCPEPPSYVPHTFLRCVPVLGMGGPGRTLLQS